MNDDFLYRLRKEPPRDFAAGLKARLASQDAEGSRRVSLVRELFLGLLVGGSALAATLWAVHAVRDDGTQSVAARTAQVHSPSNDRSPAAEQRTAGESTARSTSQIVGSAEPSTVPNIQGVHRGAHADASSAQPSSRPQAEPVGGFARNSVAAGSERARNVAPIRVAGPATTIAFAERVAQAVASVETEAVTNDEAFARLCADTEPADAVLATRRMTQRDIERCSSGRSDSILEAKLGHILEAKLGHIAVVAVSAKTALPLPVSRRDLYLAIAKHVPDPTDPHRFITNPNTTWRQIIPGVDDRTIRVFGPQADTQLARVIAELVMEPGCESFESIRALKASDPGQYRRICHDLREDSAYTPVYESEVFLTQTLWADPNAIALLSFPFFDRYRTHASAMSLGGEEPTRENILAQTYAGSAPIYLYSMSERMNRTFRLKMYLEQFLNERWSGRIGSLLSDELIPLADSEMPIRMQRLQIENEPKRQGFITQQESR